MIKSKPNVLTLHHTSLPPTQPSTCPPASLPAGGGSYFLLCKSQKRGGSITPNRGRVFDPSFIDRNEHHESMVKHISKHIKSSKTSLSLQRAPRSRSPKSCFGIQLHTSNMSRNSRKGATSILLHICSGCRLLGGLAGGNHRIYAAKWRSTFS